MQRIQEISKNATSESKIPTKLEKIQFTIFSAPFSLDTLKISYETSLRKKATSHKTITELPEM